MFFDCCLIFLKYVLIVLFNLLAVALKGGELPMKTQDALIALETVLRYTLSQKTRGPVDSIQVGICRVEWSRSEWKHSPLIASLNEERVPYPPTS